MKIPFQAAAVVTLFATQAVHAQGAVQWKVSDGGNGHWYQLLVNQQSTFWQCASAATSRGGHLVSITDQNENAFVRQISLGHFVHFGAFQDPSAAGWGEPASGWTWVNGEPWTWAGWCASQPDNAPWGGFAGQELARFASSSGTCWDDAHSMQQIATWAIGDTMIEWSADCNNDGIVDYGQCRDGTLPDYDSDNIPDCCESGTLCVIGSYPLQWLTSDGGNGHWYQVVIGTTDQSWEASRIAAGSRGGYLATLTSEAENQWLHAVAVRHPSAFQNHGPWLGGYRSGSDWRWITDEAWLFAAWTPDNPSGDGVAMGYWEIGNPAAESWNDAPESNHMISFVAEWSADCNSDGIVDYGQILRDQLADTNADGVPDICQGPTCADADIYRDFNVNGADLGILLSQWGPNTPLTESDLNGDGVVNGADLGLLLSFWGACP